MIMYSTEGGVDIETVAEKTPELEQQFSQTMTSQLNTA